MRWVWQSNEGRRKGWASARVTRVGGVRQTEGGWADTERYMCPWGRCVDEVEVEVEVEGMQRRGQR